MPTLAETYNLAVSAYDRGEIEPALAMFARFQPEHGHFYFRSLGYIGRILAQQGKPEAEAYLRESVRQLRDPDTIFQLAELFFHQSRTKEAESAYRKVIELDPKFTDAFIRLGMILRDRNQAQEAIRSFELAILNDQRAVVARYFLAQLCAEQSDHKRALSQLHFVLKLQPDYQPARLLMADIFQKLGDHRQALVEFCSVVNSGSQDASVFLRLARSFQAIGDRPQALKAYEQAFGLDRTLYPAAASAAQMREEMGHYERACDLYRHLCQSPDYQRAANEAIDRLERLFAQYDLADRSEHAPESPEAYFEAPPVQQKSATEPFLGPSSFNTSDLAARKPIRTAPIRLAEVPYDEPPALDGFLKGMMDTVFKHVPAEARDVVRQRLDDFDSLRQKLDFDALKQKVDLDAIKRRFGR